MSISTWRQQLQESWDHVAGLLWPESPSESRCREMDEVHRHLVLHQEALLRLARRGERLRDRLTELDHETVQLAQQVQAQADGGHKAEAVRLAGELEKCRRARDKASRLLAGVERVYAKWQRRLERLRRLL